MKFRTQIGAMMCFLSLLSVQADASIVQLINTGNSQAMSNSQAPGGVAEGFYNLTVDSTAVLGMCDDFFTHTSVGQIWTGYAYDYSQVTGNPALVKFSPLTNYSAAGWLFSQLPIPGSGIADYTLQAETAFAIQKIMDSSVDLSSPANAGALALYTSALSHTGFDWSSVMMVVTADPSSASQEYLIPAGLVPPNEVPVPASVWLLGSGLAGFVAVSRRGKRPADV